MTEISGNLFAGRSDDWRAGYEAGIASFASELTLLRERQRDDWQQRALEIISQEEGFAANDPEGNVELHALRLTRVMTAKQILGTVRMSERVIAADDRR